MINIIDLDNTLVFTDEANNKSYIDALKLFEIKLSEIPKRITREYIIKYVCADCECIILKKEDLFCKYIDCCNLNITLFDKIKTEKNILWTSASPKRVKQILNYLNINNIFIDIIYSSKQSPLDDISKICSKFETDFKNIIVYEDNYQVIDKLRIHSIECNHI